MWMNKLILVALVMLLAFSCKKEFEPWDKEVDLSTDTSLYLNKVEYVSHTEAEAFFDFQFVQFNQLECETGYEGIYIDEWDNSNYDLEAYSQTVETLTPIGDYSSIFLFEGIGYELYRQGEAAFYLRRYFEFIEANSANKRIGMATYNSDDNSTINFHKENGTLFGNSAEYNDSILVDLIHRSELNSGSSDNSGNGLIQVLFAAIDELAANPMATGDKSITMFDDYENNFGYGYSSIITDSIANKALANNVKINVVLLNGYGLSRLAIQTGGFIVDQREANKVNFFDPEYTLSNIGNNLANLDRILSQNLTVHNVRVKAIAFGGVTFNSGYYVQFDLVYGNDIFLIQLTIP